MNIRNEPTPYMLNILERDFLCEAAEHLVVQRDARQIPRLFTLLESITIRKILSASFYGLVAIIQQDAVKFEELAAFFFSKYLNLLIKLDDPKEPILDILPYIIGKAILLCFK